MRASMRTVLGSVTLADLANGDLPPSVLEIIAAPGAHLPG